MERAEMKDIESVLYSREALIRRIEEMAGEIERDYQGKELVCVGILKGAVFFFSELMLRVKKPVFVDFMAISSYGMATKTSGVVQVIKDLTIPVVGKHVLIIEDIVDSGLTLSYLTKSIASRQALSVKVCALLDKPARRKVVLEPDYCGFTVEDHFIVGFGLDYRERYRTLPDICVLRPSVYKP